MLGTISEKQWPAFGVRTGKASKDSPKPSSPFQCQLSSALPWGPLARTVSPALGSALALPGGHFGQDQA